MRCTVGGESAGVRDGFGVLGIEWASLDNVLSEVAAKQGTGARLLGARNTECQHICRDRRDTKQIEALMAGPIRTQDIAVDQKATA